jgi:phospholipid/cholesterol/gamma-HCH transport system ATP-binding protein
MEYKIQIKKLCKSFGTRVVLSNLDIDIRNQESHVVIGPSGTGKSVLLKVLAGLVPSDSGSIFVDGIETTHLSEKERAQFFKKLAIVFQGCALFDSLKIWENVAFGLMHGQGIPASKAKKIAIENLELVGLNADIGEQKPNELSGGMQRRVAIARAIIMKPKILLFDEPTAGLDPITAELINTLIRKCHTELNVTTFTITHDLSTVHTVADRVSMLNNGSIVWSGSKKDMKNSDNLFVQKFIHQHFLDQ